MSYKPYIAIDTDSILLSGYSKMSRRNNKLKELGIL